MVTSAPDRRPIGILGGMFDPVHYGHLRIALELQQALDLAEMRLLPCGQPPHRGPTSANAAQRLKMLQLAITNEPALAIDRSELDRPGPSYMVDTLASIREQIGSRPLCLVLGMDAFAALPGWHRWQQLPRLAHLVVVQRPGQTTDLPEQIRQLLAQRQARDARQLHTQAAGNILLQPATRLEISSTRIRAMLAKGENPRYLLPDPVLDLIRREKLYLT